MPDPARRMAAFFPVLRVVLCVVFCVQPLSAQIASTSLRGEITDSSGARVPGATIEIANKAIGLHESHSSDDRGEYQINQIAPGTYNVTVSAPGLAMKSFAVELLVNQPATLNVVLSVEATTNTVIVSSDTASLNTTDASIGNAVNNATIEALPMEGRNVPDLLSLQPGVLYLGHNNNQSADSRSGAVAGARSDQGNVTLDGLDDNDQTQGYAFTGVLRSTLDSVEEFRVTTTNSNADSGRSSGAQVNMVTKSGTNQLHGALYEYNRNTLTVANDWFNKQAELSEGLPNKAGKLIRNTYGASLGGPVKKDRLFYFLNFEQQRTAENEQKTMTVPTALARAGNISYYYGNSLSVYTLNPTQIAGMDPKCSANGTCPWGPGIDPNALATLNQYPLPNGAVAGDGFNSASFSWSAPNPTVLTTYIGKIDFAVSDKHRLSVRGNLQDDSRLDPPEFPGQPASNKHSDNSKGIAVNDTYTFNQNLVNNGRYGFVRQGYSDSGIGQGSYVSFEGLSNLTAQTRDTILHVPVHNFIDDLTWTHHSHTIQFGVNYRLVHNDHNSNSLSFSSAQVAGLDVTDTGVANTGQSLDPAQFGFPAVSADFANAYSIAIGNITGLLPMVINQYDYAVDSTGATGTLLNPGAMIDHNYKSNEFESYVQDSWRVKPNLTVTLGVRYTLLQTPYEIHGQQVAPSIDVDQWFKTRVAQAALGNTVQPAYSFVPSGQARGKQPYWPMGKKNFAPRFAVAYSPAFDGGPMHKLFGGAGASSIRAGFGMYYDHFGEGIVNSFSQYGAYGLSGSVQTPFDIYTPDATPRYTGLHNLPSINPASPSQISYPYTPSTDPNNGGFAVTWGLDNRLKTPYSYAADLSVQRQLKSGFTIEAAYVGRFGRHLMQQLDLSMPLDLVDPQSGMDYFTAARLLTVQGYQGAATVQPIAYWEDLFPDAAGMDVQGTGAPGNSATQNIYNLYKGDIDNASLDLYNLDILCNPGCGGKIGRYYPLEFSSLYAWSSIGTSSYNAGQFTLRHTMSHGLQTDFSYTLSKSLDLGSDSERACTQCNYSVVANSFNWIMNAFNPRLNRGPSDFDTRHMITGDWVYRLPFGHDGLVASGAGPRLNWFVGGWQLSGLARWTSGLPFSLLSGGGWETDWAEESAMIRTGPIKMHKHLNASGVPEVFADPASILAGIQNSTPLRNPYPGDAGERNNFRGDGYFGIDSGLSKYFPIRESQGFRFTWEVFNVTNSARFDVNPENSLQNQTNAGSSFGVYGATITQPRIQQFSLRYSF
jgi:hypothetical protein